MCIVRVRSGYGNTATHKKMLLENLCQLIKRGIILHRYRKLYALCILMGQSSRQTWSDKCKKQFAILAKTKEEDLESCLTQSPSNISRT